jgi:hypothetical protein
MRGVITQVQKNKAALLLEDGTVLAVNNKNYEIGQEVTWGMATTINFKRLTAMTAAVCMMLVAGGGALAYYTPVSYVSMDVNPSIEYKLNMFERVLSVKGINDDGTEIVEEIDLANLGNKTIEEALALTVQRIAEKGYLDSGDAGIVITTSAKDLKKAEAMAEQLQEKTQETVLEQNKPAEISAEAVGAERVAEAQQLGVTPGKLNLVEKMMSTALDSGTLNREEWLKRSVKDIMAQTKQFREETKAAEKNAGEETQNKEQQKTEAKNGEPAAAPGKSGDAPGNQDDKATGKPAENPGNKPEDKTTGKPEDTGKSDDRTTGKPEDTGKSDDRTTGKPAESPGNKPEDKTTGKPEDTGSGSSSIAPGNKPDNTDNSDKGKSSVAPGQANKSFGK